MKKFYIQVNQDNTDILVSLLTLHLKLSKEKALYLINIGAVWDKNTNLRLKDPDKRCRNELIVVHKPDYEVPVYPFHKSDIIYEEQGFFIVYKKGKYPTVPTPYSDVNSLSYALSNYFSKNAPDSKAYVINRLDTHTQGLVFFAKDKKTEKILHSMFKHRQVKKWYMVGTQCFDEVKKNYLIQDSLEWNGKNKPARTFIRLFKKTETGYCFLARPYTGRTHQIRKHFAQYLVPILGDPVYGNGHRNDTMVLLCFAYIFPHPVTGKKMKVKYVPEYVNFRTLM